jgi:hypothetical protein
MCKCNAFHEQRHCTTYLINSGDAKWRRVASDGLVDADGGRDCPDEEVDQRIGHHLVGYLCIWSAVLLEIAELWHGDTILRIPYLLQNR